QRGSDQQNGRRQALSDDADDRPAVDERLPEISGGDPADVDDELLGQRAIQSELRPDERIVRRVAVLAGKGEDWIAGRRVHGDEDDQQKAGDSRDDLNQTPQQVARRHRSALAERGLREQPGPGTEAAAARRPGARRRRLDEPYVRQLLDEDLLDLAV